MYKAEDIRALYDEFGRLPGSTIEGYKHWAAVRLQALDRALALHGEKGAPAEKVIETATAFEKYLLG